MQTIAVVWFFLPLTLLRALMLSLARCEKSGDQLAGFRDRPPLLASMRFFRVLCGRVHHKCVLSLVPKVSLTFSFSMNSPLPLCGA
ncbi:hypothetical protein BC940DRAFT_291141 [Gongronella butleri]|nr:hypothetical protein BC940DRAFT_291141 [Gongronella butleri]